MVALAPCVHAQVLARPGWAGSGVTNEPWWRRAVFYRIQPELFQDSDADGKGDLKGIGQRLGYIQQLGVDAIILVPPVDPNDFGDLARQASQMHLRVLVEMTKPDPAEARMWLTQGAAGLYVDAPQHSAENGTAMHDLRHLIDKFPGQRVLIGTLVPGKPNDGPELTIEADLNGTEPNAGLLRRQLLSMQQGGVAKDVNPVLELRGLPVPRGSEEQQALLDRTLATMLLASRAAVILDAGRELGMRSFDGKSVVLQWTPTNIKPKPIEEAKPEEARPKQEVYGAFTPYIRPPKNMLPPPAMPKIEIVEKPPVDPNSLPGFTDGKLPDNIALNGATANAAVEDTDESSLLNFYRHLIALHHDNASLRNGLQVVLDQDAQNTVLWIRRAPAGSTAATVLVACNLADIPVQLNLHDALVQQRISSGALRPLLTASTKKLTSEASPETLEKVILPASTVYLGEIYRSVSLARGHR